MATYSLIGHIQAPSTDSSTITTGTLDTTGADLIVICMPFGADPGTTLPTDNKGNTYTALTKHLGGLSDRWHRIYYCQGGTVGSGHTFSWSLASSFPMIQASAWSGSGSTPFDVENGTGNTFNTSNQTGSVTPSTNNQLIIAGLCFDPADTPTIDSGFTILDTQNDQQFGHQSGQHAYLIETTATAQNPTFSWTNASRNVSSIATFKAGGGSPTVINSNFFHFM